MKTLILLTALANLGVASSSSAETTDCRLAVDRARNDLGAAHLRQIIAKPSLNFVSKDGVVYTDTKVSAIRRQIGLARDSCRSGDSAASMRELQKMYAILYPAP